MALGYDDLLFYPAQPHLYVRQLVTSTHYTASAVQQTSFLDASSHLYKRVCQSVRPSVGWLVGRSVTRFFLIAKMKVFLHVCHQGGPGTSQKCRITSLKEGLSVGPSVYLRTLGLTSEVEGSVCTLPGLPAGSHPSG